MTSEGSPYLDMLLDMIMIKPDTLRCDHPFHQSRSHAVDRLWRGVSSSLPPLHLYVIWHENPVLEVEDDRCSNPSIWDQVTSTNMLDGRPA